VKIHPAERLVKLPDGIAFEQAACMMLQGLTVHYLLRRTYPVKAGETILFHAAAGGVGLIVCQWAKALGANLIGTVGSEEKAALAREHGAAHTIIYTKEDFLARVKEITGGKGVPVVYDSIGKDTFVKSLDCLQPRGLMVSFGNATGPVDGFNVSILAAKGSLYLTRPTLDTHIGKREAAATDELRPRGGRADKGRAAPAPSGRGAGAPRPRGPQDHHDPGAVNLRRAGRAAMIGIAALALVALIAAFAGAAMGLFAGKLPAASASRRQAARRREASQLGLPRSRLPR
jgi:NADPH:quinone reductase-like Zn-dependent oxidoreductase